MSKKKRELPAKDVENIARDVAEKEVQAGFSYHMGPGSLWHKYSWWIFLAIIVIGLVAAANVFGIVIHSSQYNHQDFLTIKDLQNMGFREVCVQWNIEESDDFWEKCSDNCRTKYMNIDNTKFFSCLDLCEEITPERCAEWSWILEQDATSLVIRNYDDCEVFWYEWEGDHKKWLASVDFNHNKLSEQLIESKWYWK